jgi:hypothetical protein
MFAYDWSISDKDWVVQTSIKFKSQLNPKCKLNSCIFQVNVLILINCKLNHLTFLFLKENVIQYPD